MALLLRKTRQPAEAGPTEDVASSAPTPYTSQAFELWDAESRSGDRRRVVDLGMASGDNIRFFGEQPCSLEIVGLSEQLPLQVTVGEDDDPDELETAALQEHLPDLPPRSQHGALCWDILNYLTRAQIIALGNWLSDVLALDGVVLLSLHTGTAMPERPGRFHVQTASSLVRSGGHDDARTVACPRYSQGDLKRDWPGFEVLRSYLLRSESQEFVLRRI